MAKSDIIILINKYNIFSLWIGHRFRLSALLTNVLFHIYKKSTLLKKIDISELDRDKNFIKRRISKERNFVNGVFQLCS